MSADRMFSEKGLAFARRDVVTVPADRAKGNDLVAVDDAAAWRLAKEHVGGFRHVWEHLATEWLSQTLTVPAWALADPAKARAWARGRPC